MDLNKYTDQLRADLSAAAALGDDHTRTTAEALGHTAEASARLMILGALSDFAAEISEQLGDRDVHVRLDGTNAHAEIRRTDAPADADASPPTEDYPTMEDVSGEVRRVTLRMVEHVKERAEEAANSNGISLNSWLSQAVQGALRDQMRKERRTY